MKKRKLKVDKLLMFVNTILVVVVVLSAAFSKAWLSKTNIDLESAKEKVSEQAKRNESLAMKVNEYEAIELKGSAA
mgnify:CR=1 FL=1